MQRWVVCLSVLLLSGCLSAPQDAPDDPAGSSDGPPVFTATGPVRQTRTAGGITELAADVWRPDTGDPVPAVLIHTPYVASLSGTWEDGWALQELVPRGYAVVVAHARGTGGSGGCNDYYGAEERKDGVDWVAWIRDQEWSDGRVGAMGHSYSGGTALILATADPDGLDAVAAVAGVTNPYQDLAPGGAWGYGTTTEPLTYAVLETAYNPGEDPAAGTCSGVTVPTMGALGVYDDFFEERDWTEEAADVRAAVLMVHGQADTNVGFGNLADFFPAIPATKSAVVGPWDHTSMLDAGALTETLLAWFDEHLPAAGAAQATPPQAFGRLLDDWPETQEGAGTWNGTGFGADVAEDTWQVGGPLQDPLRLSVGLMGPAPVAGRPSVTFTAVLQDPSTVFHARLGCSEDDAVRGHLNALLHESRDRVTPVTPGEPVRFTVSLEPFLGDLPDCAALWLDASLPPRELEGSFQSAPVTIVSGPEDPLVLSLPLESTG